MQNPFLFTEDNLGRAGMLLALEFVSITVVGVVLSYLGQDGRLALLAAIPFQLAIAWFLSQAAKRKGKNPIIFGLVALPAPPLALMVFCYFSLQNSWALLAAIASAKRRPN